MNKPTITEALQARIPLPWKQSTCDGPPIWKVERQRPEDFTAEIYQKLKKYGMKEDEIRTLFCITNEYYATLKREIGATVPDECIEESKKQIGRRLKNFMPRGPKQAEIIPMDRPRVVVDPVPDAPPHAPTAEEIADAFRPEDDQPVPFVPVTPEPALQARIEIICNGATIYDLEQLHSNLMDLHMRKKAVVSGTLRIVI